MKDIIDYKLGNDEAAIWFLGQAGYVIKSAGMVLVIDPYLSDSATKVLPELTRNFPSPLEASELKADIFIVTHNHLDHLDPETVAEYRYKNDTTFVAPRLAVKKLLSLGIPPENIFRIDSGDVKTVKGVEIIGIYAIPNEPDVIDTCGYKIKFRNGRSVYHSSDTGFSELLLECVPDAEAALLCINGKWGNMGPHEAAKVAIKMRPKIAIPNHYDVMSINSENPETFKLLTEQDGEKIRVEILEPMKVFVWR
jgi:L-ascorbate 6-phosphate lactonase